MNDIYKNEGMMLHHINSPKQQSLYKSQFKDKTNSSLAPRLKEQPRQSSLVAGFDTNIFSPHPRERKKLNTDKQFAQMTNEFQQPIKFRNHFKNGSIYNESESEDVSMQSADMTHNANMPKNIIPKSDVIKIERDS